MNSANELGVLSIGRVDLRSLATLTLQGTDQPHLVAASKLKSSCSLQQNMPAGAVVKRLRLARCVALCRVARASTCRGRALCATLSRISAPRAQSFPGFPATPLVPSAANSQWRATMEISGSSPLPAPWTCARTLLLRAPRHHASERWPGAAPSSLAPPTRSLPTGIPQDTRRGSEVLYGSVLRHCTVPRRLARLATASQHGGLLAHHRAGGSSPSRLRVLCVLCGEVCPQGGGRSRESMSL